MATKRKLMSENPNLVAAGKTVVSLAELGGVNMLSTPRKAPVKGRRVVVMPPKPPVVDQFPDEDEVLRLVQLENSVHAPAKDTLDNGKDAGPARDDTSD